MYLYLFFFFKQKTAYELRISDWSSDVCSSDLLWDIAPEKHVPGRVIHTQGWPLGEDANGGGFLYHQAGGQVALGFVTWLNYRNPYLSPFQEMQRWKTHPAIRESLERGQRVSYGARASNAGGWQADRKSTSLNSH